MIRKLDEYGDKHSNIFNFVCTRGCVYVPRAEVTMPEPDIVCFQDVPLNSEDIASVGWEDLTPVLIVEVVSEDDPVKDLIRNVALYRQIPTVREYWIIDPRESWNYPTMTVYRRRGRKWQPPIVIPGGETYNSPKFLPGFQIVLHRKGLN